MAAIDFIQSFGRMSPWGNPTVLPFTISANGATYTTASGGLPIDLQPVLTQQNPFSQPYRNPYDVIGIDQIGVPSSGGYFPYALVFVPANCTFGPATYPWTGGSINSIHPVQVMLTAPATIRLYTKAGVEFTDGVCNETGITIALVVAAGGTNA
jgi:hypothetical protein